ncbi:hypothetical protein TNCV_580471 [Trichonephila clavipes]|nr:hypothetical protein TNCV_580471 [Trichonephila clavipes]
MTGHLCSATPGSIKGLKVKYVPPTKAARDVESLLFGRIWENNSTIGPSPHHAVYFEADGWRGNCAGHLTVGEIKGGQRTISPRTSAPKCPTWDTFPRKTA